MITHDADDIHKYMRRMLAVIPEAERELERAALREECPYSGCYATVGHPCRSSIRYRRAHELRLKKARRAQLPTIDHNEQHVRIIDHQANSTRYLCVAALMASMPEKTWCVSFPLLTGTCYLVQEGVLLTSSYVQEKWQCPPGDAREMTRAIALAVPGVRCV